MIMISIRILLLVAAVVVIVVRVVKTLWLISLPLQMLLPGLMLLLPPLQTHHLNPREHDEELVYPT
jgi:hypothetical protein